MPMNQQEKNTPSAEQLVARWQRLGLKPYRIAVDLGLDWRTVRHMEQGTSSPLRQTRQMIDRYLSKLEAGQ